MFGSSSVDFTLSETICIGCSEEDDNDFAHTVYFDVYSHIPYAIISHQLSLAFFQAEILSKKGCQKPFKIDIFVSKLALGKIKKDDAEECIERIKIWIKNMVPPSCPLVIKIWVYRQQRQDYIYNSPTDQFSALWLLQPTEKYANTEKKYITFQKYELYGDPDKGASNPRKLPGENYLQDAIKLEAEKRNIELVSIDYTTPLQEAIDLLSHSSMHFSYFGASYYIAAALNKKTYVFGNENKMITEHVHGAYYQGPWAGNKVTQIKRFKNTLYTDNIKHFTPLIDVDHVKEIFEGI